MRRGKKKKANAKYLLKSYKLIQQYIIQITVPTFQLASGAASCKTTIPPKNPNLHGWTFSLGTESGWEIQVKGEMPVLPWSTQVICRSLGLRDKCKVCPLDLSFLFPGSFLPVIHPDFVTLFPLTHESPSKAQKAHLKSNQINNPALYNDMSGLSESFFALGLED